MPDIDPIIKPSEYNADLPVAGLPLSVVTEVNNMITDDGIFRQAEPYQNIFGATLFQPRWLLPNQSAGDAFWIYAGDQDIGVVDGGSNHSDITPAGGLQDATLLSQPYTGGVINGLPVINSMVDGPFWWDQNVLNDMVILPDWPAGDICDSMRPFREFLIAMNIFTGGARINDLLRWSDAAAPGDIPRSWTPDVDTQAGEISVSFNPGGIVDGRQLGDRFYVYKTSSAYVLQLIGGAFVFNQRPAFSTVGLLARSALVEYRGRHIMMTDGDVVAHDGVNVESLVSRKQRREIFQDLDGSNAHNSYLTLDIGTSQLGIARPSVGDTYPSEVITLNLEDLRFGRRQLIRTGTPHATLGLIDVGSITIERDWDDRTTTWATDPTRWNSASFLRTHDFILAADYENSKIQHLGAGNDFDGEPLVASFSRAGITFGDSDLKKNVGRVSISIDGAIDGEIQIEFGAHDVEALTPAYAPAQTFIIGTTKTLNFDVTGYYIAYRVSALNQLDWRFVQMKVEVTFLGKY